MAPPAARSKIRAKPEEAPPPPPPDKKKVKWLAPAVVGAVLLLAVIAALFFQGTFKKFLGGSSQEADSANAAGDDDGVDLTKPPAFVPLDPFTVNLKEEEGSKRYLQTNLSLRVSNAKTAEELVAFVPEIRHRINLLLASKMPSELSSKDAREALAEQIASEVNVSLGFASVKDSQGRVRSRGPVKAVLFNSFLVQ